MQRILTALVGLLIVYGSLYPFDFGPVDSAAWDRLWRDASPWSSRGDMLGNVALFVPWGVFCTAALLPRRSPVQAMVLAAVSGLLLALLLQIGQIFVPARSAALSDVLWNAVGCLIGLPLGRWLASRENLPSSQRANAMAALLLAGCVVTAWLPLIPSLDWALVKSQLRSLSTAPAWHGGVLAEQSALAVLAGWALSHWFVGLRQLLAFGLLVALLLVGRLFVVQAQIDANVVAGTFAGAVAWSALSMTGGRQAPQRSALAVAVGLLLLYTLGALWPFALRDHPSSMAWLPLASLFKGQMLDNSRALLGMVLLFAGVLGAVKASGARVTGSIIVLAVWVMAVEGLQCWVDGRSGDITSAVLVLMAGAGVTLLGDQKTDTASAVNAVQPRRASVPEYDKQESTPAQSTVSMRQAGSCSHPIWALAAMVALIVTTISAGLRLPGLPYNVVELFRANGHPVILAVFALALLALGAGPGWLGRRLSTARWPLLWLPVGAVACAWATLALVWSSATDESVGDIAGSTNLVWFVTNRDSWGPIWRQIFIAINMPEAISFLERCVRWAALYGPLPLVLASLVAIHERRRAGLRLDARWTAGLLVGGGLTMWLCKGIAFDWSSTDNLNELIMPDGPWGWGGGGWLYALLLVFCLSAWALAIGALRGWMAQAGALAGCALALPLGWWLLNQGLNPAVEKYGQVFSGAQFLLGPDRKNLLLPEVLMLRWYAVQAGGVAMIAAGLWLAQRAATWRALRRQSPR